MVLRICIPNRTLAFTIESCAAWHYAHKSLLHLLHGRPTHIRCKCRRVPGLHIHRAGPCKSADEPFSRRHTRDKAAARHALHDVFTAPGYEMAVVNDVSFAFDKLRRALSAIFLVAQMRFYGGEYLRSS